MSGPGTICVLGAGSWGTVLAIHAEHCGLRVKLWEFDAERAAEVARTRLSLPFVPEHHLSSDILVTSDLELALQGSDHLLVVVPSHALAAVASEVAQHWRRRILPSGALIISATKGLEEETGRTPSQVLSDTLGLGVEEIVVLAGPSLAAEVVVSKPTALLAAAESQTAAETVQQLLASHSLRIYTSSDPLGVEIGVSLKNVIAIAAGLVAGLDLGHNAQGALLTRGLAEIARLGLRLGARRETFLGLGGIGDLVTTCSSSLSRNHQVGLALAEGQRLAQILDNMVMVAEGVRTTRSTWALAQRFGLEMPITEQIHAVLFEGKDPRQALSDLMGRPLREESWGEDDE